MHAFAVATPDEHHITDIELPDPQPTGHEVFCRIRQSGVCHSDVHLREGHFDLGSLGKLPLTAQGIQYPVVLGHEIVGEVVAVGPDVEGVQVSDVRLVFPWIGCGHCDMCRAGKENKCAQGRNLGVQQHGGFADHVLVPHERYLVDIEGLDEAWAATLACSGLTSYSAVRQAMPDEPDLPVVVLGVGGVGMMAVAVLKTLGHTRTIAVDFKEENLAKARELGASDTVNAGEENLAAKIVQVAGGQVAGVVDFVNNGDTATTALRVLRRGGRMVQVGLFGGEFTVPTSMLAINSLDIQGSYVGTLDQLRELVDIAKKGDLPHIPLTSAPLDAETVQESLDRLVAGGVTGRIVLTPTA